MQAGAELDTSSLPSGAGSSVQDAFAPPPNSSFETARSLEAGADTMQRVVNDAQVDYYSFEAQAGSFYVLSTDRSSFPPDNVITAFDPERGMIAENDDGSLYPNDGIDARLILHPQRSGTYYVTVEDRVLVGADAEGHFIPPLFYSLSLREITADSGGYVLKSAAQPPAAIEWLQDARTKNRYVTVLGELSDDNEVDTYELQGLPDHALIGELIAAGTDGDGSTAARVGVRVTADSDGHLLASCSLAARQNNIHPPVDDAKYRIQVSAGGPVGSNGYYAVDLVLLPDNPHEQTDAENDDIGSAEPIALSGASNRRGLLLSRLPAQDVDYYRFPAQADDVVGIHCEGESGGSGVRGLRAELLAPTMQQLAAAQEITPKPLVIEPLALESSGTYYLKLSSATPPVQDTDADAVEPWVRCAVLLGR